MLIIDPFANVLLVKEDEVEEGSHTEQEEEAGGGGWVEYLHVYHPSPHRSCMDYAGHEGCSTLNFNILKYL